MIFCALASGGTGGGAEAHDAKNPRSNAIVISAKTRQILVFI
jgi:hypothetical protein